MESTIELVGSQPPLGSRNSAKSGRERSERPIWSGKRSARLGSPFSLDVPRVNRRSVDLSVVRVSRLDVGDRWSSGSAMGPTAFAGGARPKDPFVFQGLNDPPTSLVFTDGWMHEPNSRSINVSGALSTLEASLVRIQGETRVERPPRHPGVDRI